MPASNNRCAGLRSSLAELPQRRQRSVRASIRCGDSLVWTEQIRGEPPTNAKRIVLAGLAAGLVNPGIPAFWIAFDFLLGIVLAFLYASLRPRFGAGPRTALIAGSVAWFLIHVTLASHMIDGVFPARILLGTGGLELMSELVGAWVAGRFYIESSTARTHP